MGYKNIFYFLKKKKIEQTLYIYALQEYFLLQKKYKNRLNFTYLMVYKNNFFFFLKLQ